MTSDSTRTPASTRAVFSFLAWATLLIFSACVGAVVDRTSGHFADQIFSNLWWAAVLSFVPWCLTLPAVLFFSQRPLLIAGLILPAPLAAAAFLFVVSGHHLPWDLYTTAPIWIATLISCVYAATYVFFIYGYQRGNQPL